MSQYYIIKFNDLKEEKQEEIKNHLWDEANNIDAPMKRIVDGDAETLAEIIENACNKSWVEWEVNI